MSTEEELFSGSKVLLEKIGPYQQCKAYIRQSHAGYGTSTPNEGNELMGTPQTYPLLALVRGMHRAIAVVSQSHSSTSVFAASPGERQVAEALRSPFHSIQQNMEAIPTSGKKIWWLDGGTVSGGNDLHGDPSSRAPLESCFLDAAVSLPVLTELLYPLLGSPLDLPTPSSSATLEEGSKEQRRKRPRPEPGDEGEDLIFGSAPLPRRTPFCRYGKALFARVHAETRASGATEYQTVLDAIRAPALGTDNPKEEESSGDRHRQDVNALVRYIQTSASASTSNARERSKSEGGVDVVAVHAYLKRCMWIADQSRGSRPSGVRWDEMSESERVREEMMHTLQQRARFSRPRSK